MSEPVAAPPATAKRRDPEFWIALGALGVSALAMLTSVIQVNLQRSQERALVWPHVSARDSYSADGFAVVATNKGLGPALVRRVDIEVDGRAVADWPGALDAALGTGHGYGWERITVNDLEDSILGAGEKVVLFGIGWDERTRAAFGNGARISATICYCSFLEECWSSRAGLDHASVDSCPSRPEPSAAR